MTENLLFCLCILAGAAFFYLSFIFPLRKKVSWEDYTIATLFSYGLAVTIMLAKLIFSELMK